MTVNLLDRLIAGFDPAAGYRRARARARLHALSTAKAMFDGASVSRRTAGWRRVSTDANAETIGGSLVRLRDVSRDLVRNNPYARRAVDAIMTNVVGPGIIPQFKGAGDAETKRLESLAVEHLDTRAIDAAGRHDLYGLQALIMRSVVESGEVLVRRRWRLMSDGLPLPFALQVLESDFLDSSVDGPLSGGNTAVQGIEFDKIGRRVAYWLFDEHPGGHGYKTPASKRVPAADVAHIYREDRPGQVRGVPWLAPVILRMHDFADYEDAQLMRQKIAAVFAAFITDPEGDSRPNIPGEITGANQSRVESLEPGIIERLAPGEDVTFSNPPGVEGYGEYARNQLRAMAAGLGVTYESMTGDLSEVNYSSGRLGWLEFQRSVNFWQADLIVGSFCRRVETWFIEAAQLAFGIAGPARADWTPPRREMIDPTREVPATIKAIRGGLMSPSDAVRERGKDPAVHFAELAADFKRFDALELILDCDPRRVSSAGLTQARPGGTEIPGSDIPEL